jgi:hypothetical protein
MCKILDTALDGLDKPSVEVISRHTRGAAGLVIRYARERSLGLKVFDIKDWYALGNHAEKIRNSAMIEYATQDSGVMFAFWEGSSSTTDFMIKSAINHRMDGYVFNFLEMTLTDLLSLHDKQAKQSNSET